jgi:hypothetical protein
MPPNTVKVDRTGKWGNPFDFRKLGITQATCVEMFAQLLLSGAIVEGLAEPTPEVQIAYREMAMRDIGELRDKNLACWCKIGTPCHADVLARLSERA